jgi:hypothetical protein
MVSERASEYCKAINDLILNESLNKANNTYDKTVKQRDVLKKLCSQLVDAKDAIEIKKRSDNISLDMCKMNKPLKRRLAGLKIDRLTKRCIRKVPSTRVKTNVTHII